MHKTRELFFQEKKKKILSHELSIKIISTHCEYVIEGERRKNKTNRQNIFDFLCEIYFLVFMNSALFFFFQLHLMYVMCSEQYLRQKRRQRKKQAFKMHLTLKFMFHLCSSANKQSNKQIKKRVFFLITRARVCVFRLFTPIHFCPKCNHIIE